MNKHRDIPFNAKVLIWVLGEYDYSLRYMAFQLSRIEKIGYLTEVDRGIYIFKTHNFSKVQETNPELAKQISQNSKKNDKKNG